MAFESFADFLAMGKHGAFVWSAYAITLAVVAYNVAAPIIRKQQLMREIARRVERDSL